MARILISLPQKNPELNQKSQFFFTNTHLQLTELLCKISHLSMAFRLHWRILICHGKQQETFVDFNITMPETVNIAGQVKAHTSAQVLSHKIWFSCSDWSCDDCYEIKVIFTEENQTIGCIMDLIHKIGKAATNGDQHMEQKGQQVSIDPQDK